MTTTYVPIKARTRVLAFVLGTIYWGICVALITGLNAPRYTPADRLLAAAVIVTPCFIAGMHFLLISLSDNLEVQS